VSKSLSEPGCRAAHGASYIGVGLRHQHFQDALKGSPFIDFVEVHAENFFADGSLASAFLDDFSEIYDLSLHSTSMGLGSASGVNERYLERLKRLIDRVDPRIISDHASFSWSEYKNQSIHSGDLLPLEFTNTSLNVLVENIDQAQQYLGRQLLIENVSSYIQFDRSNIEETEFLVTAAERSQSRLLVDLNNLLVNAKNESSEDPLESSIRWLDQIPRHLVGEIHLAGYSPADTYDVIIDDHSQAVSHDCWELYRYSLERFGSVATLIEWDNELPSWDTLVAEAKKARRIFDSVYTSQASANYVT